MTRRAARPSTSSRAVVASLLGAIGIGPLIADFLYRPTADRHIHNPRWPPAPRRAIVVWGLPP